MCYAREVICPMCLDDTTGLVSLVTCSKHLDKGFCKPDSMTYYIKYRPCKKCNEKYPTFFVNWNQKMIDKYINVANLPRRIKTISERTRRLKRHFILDVSYS